MKYILTLLLTFVFIVCFGQKTYDFFSNLPINIYNGSKLTFDSEKLKASKNAFLMVTHNSERKEINFLSDEESIEDFEIKTIFIDNDIIKNYNLDPGVNFLKKEIILKTGGNVNLTLNLDGNVITKSFIFGDTPQQTILPPQENPQRQEIDNNPTQFKKEFSIGENILSDAKLLVSESTKISIKKDILKGYGTNYTNVFFINNIGLTSGDENTGTRFVQNIAKTDVTNFATGMARFLAERAKAEMNDLFFSTMYNKMKNYEELQMYFSESYYYLENTQVRNSIINLQALRIHFENDIQRLPMNLYTHVSHVLVDSARYPKVSEFMNSSGGKWINLAVSTAQNSYGKMNPKDLLYDFVHGDLVARQNLESSLEKENKYGQINLLNGIKLVELISNSLLSPESNRYWVEKSEIENIFKDPKLFYTYIGLLLAKSDFSDYKIQFYQGEDSFTLKQLIENVYAAKALDVTKLTKDFLPLTNLIRDLYHVYENIDKAAEEMKRTKDSTAFEKGMIIMSILKDNVSVIGNHIRFGKLFGNMAVEFENKVLYNVIAPATDMMYHVQAKNYGLAVTSLISILKEIEVDNRAFNRFVGQFAKYGMFIGNVADAKSSDEVKAAIEQTVLPVGSSRIKRHSIFSITLNAHVGWFYGNAYYKESVDGAIFNRSVSTTGLTAPIGVGFNFGNIRYEIKDPKASSFGINLQVIDLGGLVNFYLKEGDGAQLPNNTKITIGDILAPGAYFSYSIYDSPVSVIGGLQYVNNLSRMTGISTNTDFRPLSWRWQVGIAIDIPLFNLFIKN